MSLPLHVNFHEGGQAIVGHVEHQGRVVNLALGPSLECAILSAIPTQKWGAYTKSLSV